LRPSAGAWGGALAAPAPARLPPPRAARPGAGRAPPAEPSSRGAALLALEYSVGATRDATLPVAGQVVRPDAERHQRYVAALERQAELYGMLAGRWEHD
jgi:hypothetical protein